MEMIDHFLLANAIAVIAAVIIGWRLLAKAGFPGLLVLVFFIPFVGAIFLLYLLFAKWPVEKQLKAYKQAFGPLPEPTHEPETVTSCLTCGADIPAGSTTCPKCGWTYVKAQT